jgi:hypothetical protein
MVSKFLSSSILVTALPVVALAGSVLYGGNGGHIGLGGQPNSVNNGALVTVGQTNAAVTLIGTPSGVARITGLAFDASGNLYGSTITGGGFPPPANITLTSDLIRLNPGTGALLQNPVPITANGAHLGIAEITVQPGTGVLYGVEGPDDGLNQPGNLWKNQHADRCGNAGGKHGQILQHDYIRSERHALFGSGGPGDGTGQSKSERD